MWYQKSGNVQMLLVEHLWMILTFSLPSLKRTLCVRSPLGFPSLLLQYRCIGNQLQSILHKSFERSRQKTKKNLDFFAILALFRPQHHHNPLPIPTPCKKKNWISDKSYQKSVAFLTPSLVFVFCSGQNPVVFLLILCLNHELWS